MVSRSKYATLIVDDQPVQVAWSELDHIHRLAYDDPAAATDLGRQWLNERGAKPEQR